MSLTDTEIKRAKPRDKPYRLSDSGGMYLWITPSGGRLWRWAYLHERKEKLMSLGKYPDVSLAGAREQHNAARRLLASGADPMAQRKSAKHAERTRDEKSFSSVAAKWLEHWQDGKSPRHVDSTRRRIATNILPSLGARPVAEIEAPEVVAMVRLIDSRGARDIAKRTLETTGQIFRYGVAHGFARRNPATEIRPRDILKASRRVNYARIDARELPELLRQLEVYPGTHITRLAIKLMALTFVRTGELIAATWSEFDLDAARWNIPSERMKMRTPHIVPLSTQALETLATLRPLSGRFAEEEREFNRYTLLGEYDVLFVALLRQRLYQDGIETDRLEDHFRAHMTRGLSLLQQRVWNVADFAGLVASTGS